MLAIAMHSMEASDHKTDYEDLRHKVTRAFRKASPEAYDACVRDGLITALETSLDRI
jgi:hypothetical protein